MLSSHCKCVRHGSPPRNASKLGSRLLLGAIKSFYLMLQSKKTLYERLLDLTPKSPGELGGGDAAQ